MESQVKDAGNEQSQLQDLLDRAKHRNDALEIELAYAKADLARTDTCLDRLGSDFSATRSEAERLKLAVGDLSETKQRASAKIIRLTGIIEARDETIAAMAENLEQLGRELGDMRRQVKAFQLASSGAGVATMASTGADATQSTALQRRLRNAEEDAALQRALVVLMQGMLQVLASPGKWWTSLLPGFWVRRLKYDRLRRKGLFDAKLYARRNPDVIRAKIDPLHHYVTHGLEEGRARM